MKILDDEIKKMIAAQNHQRMKILTLIFLFLGMYNVVIDFSFFGFWGEHIDSIFKNLDISLTILCLISTAFYWLSSNKNLQFRDIVMKITISLVLIWAALICGFYHNSTGFSTYLGVLMLALLFLHLTPIFSISLIWISSILLVGLVHFISPDPFDTSAIIMIMAPISIIATYVSYKKYNEKVATLQLYLEKEQLNKELQRIKENLDQTVAVRTQELNIAKEKAEESNRLKSAFLANLSHEIRTPMNAILGFSSLFLKRDFSEENQKKYIGFIYASGKRLLHTMNDIIDISKIESNQVLLHYEDVNISEIINNFIKQYKTEFAEKKLSFTVAKEMLHPEIVITSDKTKILAIFAKLINNAIKYTYQGGVSLGVHKRQTDVEFFIKDTGIGIAKDRLSAIFDRFVQADIDDVHATQGTGLGLTIVRAYVEMLHGKIWVQSKLGEGTTFYFTLPIQETFH